MREQRLFKAAWQDFKILFYILFSVKQGPSYATLSLVQGVERSKHELKAQRASGGKLPALRRNLGAHA